MSFPTTAWSMLEDAKNRDPAEDMAAKNRFIVSYWRLIYVYLRARGRYHEDAEDLTQEFLLKFLRRDWLSKADASRGRFRNYLLAILKRFLADQGPSRAPRQEHFDCSLVPVSVLLRDEQNTFEPWENTAPDEIFMRQWAKALVGEVCQELETWCRGQGRPDWYAIFKAHYFPDEHKAKPGQEAIAATLRCSRDQVRYALERTNEQFARLFRAAVAAQVPCEEDLPGEIQDIERLLSLSPGEKE